MELPLQWHEGLSLAVIAATSFPFCFLLASWMPLLWIFILCYLLMYSCIFNGCFFLFFPSSFHKSFLSSEGYLVLSRECPNGIFILKIEPNILEPLAIAWFVVLLAKPVVLFKSWPEVQCHWWGEGENRYIVLPFLATYDPCVWITYVKEHCNDCKSDIPGSMCGTSLEVLTQSPCFRQVLTQLQFSSLFWMLKSSAEIGTNAGLGSC